MSRVMAALLVLVGCSQTQPLAGEIQDCDAGKLCGRPGGPGGSGTGSGGGSGVDGSTSCGNITWSPSACEDCMTLTCCGTNMTCASSMDCVTVVNCVAAKCPTGAPACI